MAALADLWLPAWVFDVARARMLWANRVGLELWRAADLQDLLDRDFSDMSDATQTRLASVLDQVENRR